MSESVTKNSHPPEIIEHFEHVDNFENALNKLLVKAYRSIEIIEEKMIKASKNTDLTINEIHVLEAVGTPDRDDKEYTGKSISEISEFLAISLPSVTLAINKLERKGYVSKHKSVTDGRSVLVKLTRKGMKIERAHRYFHYLMIKSVSDKMSEAEKSILHRGMVKLNEFFDESIEKYDLQLDRADKANKNIG